MQPTIFLLEQDFRLELTKKTMTPTLSRLLGCLLVIALSGCGHDDDVVKIDHRFEGEYPIRVLCTTGQVAELVRRVGDEYVRVDALMGPGVDPHLYRPIVSDVNKLGDADVVFYNGFHLEGRMADLFEKMAKRKATYAVTEGLLERDDPRLRRSPDFAGMIDPHVWHDVALWSDCVSDVAAMLQTFDPAHADEYKSNAREYIGELKELHKFCMDAVAKIPSKRRVLVTAHDAFGYFGQAYGIEVHGLKGISSEDEKDIAHQEEIQAMIIERKIPAVFVESAIAPRTVQSLVEPCRAAGADVEIAKHELFADALGEAGTDESTYTGMIRHNVGAMVEALSDD